MLCHTFKRRFKETFLNVKAFFNLSAFTPFDLQGDDSSASCHLAPGGDKEQWKPLVRIVEQNDKYLGF